MNEGRPASGCSLPFIAVMAALQTIKRTLSVVHGTSSFEVLVTDLLRVTATVRAATLARFRHRLAELASCLPIASPAECCWRPGDR